MFPIASIRPRTHGITVSCTKVAAHTDRGRVAGELEDQPVRGRPQHPDAGAAEQLRRQEHPEGASAYQRDMPCAVGPRQAHGVSCWGSTSPGEGQHRALYSVIEAPLGRR